MRDKPGIKQEGNKLCGLYNAMFAVATCSFDAVDFSQHGPAKAAAA